MGVRDEPVSMRIFTDKGPIRPQIVKGLEDEACKLMMWCQWLCGYIKEEFRDTARRKLLTRFLTCGVIMDDVHNYRKK